MHNKKISSLFFPALWLIFAVIFLISLSYQSKAFDLENNPNLQNLLKASSAVQQYQYEKALLLITGQKSQDYYNRWTLQTLIAYQDALQKTVTWLQNAQILITQAQQNFTKAQQLQLSNTLNPYIQKNLETTQTLSTIIGIKTCYGMGQSIINTLDTIISGQIPNIQELLNNENNLIQTTNLPAWCADKLQNIATTSQRQMTSLQTTLIRHKESYNSDFKKKIQDPQTCTDNPYDTDFDEIIAGQKALQTYQQNHENTIETLKDQSSQEIAFLCDQAKDDSQINEEIDQDIQNLANNFPDDKQAKPATIPTPNQKKYQEFFDQNEKKILQEIKNINIQWINKTLEIKGSWDYTPQSYIDQMFNQFYGNPADFTKIND